MNRDALELEIFDQLTEYEIKTLGDQKDLCARIAGLFPPHDLTKMAMKSIVEQLEACGYECEAGPLEHNIAFRALVELASVKLDKFSKIGYTRVDV